MFRKQQQGLYSAGRSQVFGCSKEMFISKDAPSAAEADNRTTHFTARVVRLRMSPAEVADLLEASGLCICSRSLSYGNLASVIRQSSQ